MRARALVLACLCVAVSAFLARAEQSEPVSIKEPLGTFPYAMGAWRGGDEPPMSKPVLDVLGVDEYLLRSYRRTEGTGLGLYVGYYQSQRQGDTMHSPLNCLPGAGWMPVEQGHASLQVTSHARPRLIEINRVIIQKGLDRMLVLYWYQSHGRVVASEYWGKVYTVVDAIRENRTDGALVRITVPIPDGPEGAAAADATGRAFIDALFPALEPHLPS